MKYSYIYVILIILVAAIGCSKVQVPADTTPSAQAAQNTAETNQEAPASSEITYELGSDEKIKALDMEMGKKTTVSTPYKIMQIGDVYVFGIGIKNVMPTENKFRLDIHFKEAKTTGGLATLIDDADDDVMLTWIAKNRFSIISINGNEETVVPLIVEVMPQIGPGKNTIPGSYVFDVDIKYETSSNSWDDYEPNTLTIKVKE